MLANNAWEVGNPKTWEERANSLTPKSHYCTSWRILSFDGDLRLPTPVLNQVEVWIGRGALDSFIFIGQLNHSSANACQEVLFHQLLIK